jgi:hypothetical protein
MTTTAAYICLGCTHYHHMSEDPETCEAFPEGIPWIVLSGQSTHQEPIDGDGGVVFHPRNIGQAKALIKLIERNQNGGTPVPS